MNETLISILDRSSTRNFKDTPLNNDQFNALKNAALAAPTATDKQENRFVFVTNKALIEKVNQQTQKVLLSEGRQDSIERLKQRGADSIFYGAPLVIFIYSQDSKYAVLDSGIAVQNLALAAHSLGLGSCINGLCERAFRRQVEGNLCAELGFAED
ncbi:MAG TPA: nitroreductase family protein, partial [Clostridiaceae bacterium]|nr:nitroreductase family protein [Clostridiaceae bacterium]